MRPPDRRYRRRSLLPTSSRRTAVTNASSTDSLWPPACSSGSKRLSRQPIEERTAFRRLLKRILAGSDLNECVSPRGVSLIDISLTKCLSELGGVQSHSLPASVRERIVRGCLLRTDPLRRVLAGIDGAHRHPRRDARCKIMVRARSSRFVGYTEFADNEIAWETMYPMIRFLTRLFVAHRHAASGSPGERARPRPQSSSTMRLPCLRYQVRIR